MSTEESRQQDGVVLLARTLHYRCYHTLMSQGSAFGYPDLSICRPPRFLLAEIKTNKGDISIPQIEWLRESAQSGIEVYLWRLPMDWAEVEQVLIHGPLPGFDHLAVIDEKLRTMKVRVQRMPGHRGTRRH